MYYIKIENQDKLITFEDYNEACQFCDETKEETILLEEIPKMEYIEIDESMDGDHASALASAGWGTDEDYE